MTTDVGWGTRCIQLIPRCGFNRTTLYKFFMLILTFFAYTSYHLSRKPISVVKPVLHKNCSTARPINVTKNHIENITTDCGYAPFDGKSYEEMLGSLDYAYLFAYAVGMFLSGHIAERVNLRYFLTGGMLLSGIFTMMFGFARYWKIHSFTYFIAMQIICGAFQSTGWPSVVTVVGNWFGKGRRGFIMGVWNSHTSVGNILGSLIAGVFVNDNWGLSFIVPGIIISTMGIVVFFFLVPKPEDIGCDLPDQSGGEENNYRVPPDHIEREHYYESLNQNADDDDEEPLVNSEQGLVKKEKAISFFNALKIPGVIEFALCLFFAKLVSYTFLFWLPSYIKHTMHTDPEVAADYSTLFDVGGIVGGILAGVVSDLTGAKATTCVVMLAFAAPAMFIYETYASVSNLANILLLLITGSLVNGPYALITTAVSADLGTHQSLRGNSHALATVTAIIDGTGSMGAALGPLLTGLINPTGWHNVFYMLIAADIAALLLLLRLLYKEFQAKCCPRESAP
ncbi:unnamed protein product [Owenia fusiformis]|uniref:Sugar phosphate exchanger 3 n=1 Tax=Owenia fusiformis TaxID=6347 RepID=A0A8S4PWI1_OWEFU|nr:unnamed protein product [Owenia fusiformis]